MGGHKREPILQIQRNIKSRLSLEKIEAAAVSIDPVFLNTPQFQSEAISHHLGMSMVLKVETVNPIRCFKGRGADFFLSCLPAGPPRLVCSSAGNFGQGLAYAARKRGFQVVVFAAESASPMKVDCMRQLGAEVRLFGRDMGEAKEQARAFAEQTHARFIEDGREPEITEGAGTMALELCRWITPLDVLLVPVGDGALIRGIGRWMKSHSPVTRIVGVCAAGAPAMAMSWSQDKLCSTESVSTIADGIAVRVPVPEALDDFNELVDDMLTVEDAPLIEAMQLVFRHHGLVTEPAGVAGLAAALAYSERFRGAQVATPLCGGNLTTAQIKDWLSI
jgi:threonine dehydratase